MSMSGRKRPAKEISSNKAQIPVLHAKMAAEKSLEAAIELITSTPQAAISKFEVSICRVLFL